MKFKKLIFLLFLSTITNTLNAQNKDFREYTDVLNYSINLNITDFENKIIKGNTVLLLNLKENPEQIITLDFEALNVDSVSINNKIISNYKYDKRYLTIPYTSKQLNNIEITVWYNGTPKKDRAWGGFYFTKNAAYNMGVGMASDPKGYGRVWYPCNDNFIDKATYKYNITVPKGLMAVCSGILKDSVENNDNTKTFSWENNKEIPTYVSSVAVAEYSVIKDTYKGIKREIPIELYINPELKKKAHTSFRNLKKALKIFETGYGEYVWERVGYVSVPFRAGAMEHSCNIAYPEYAIDGTRDRETLMAHELSHSWFGNLVTCKTAQDMWLNEGWATFSEALFKEKFYGHTEYMDYVLNNHIKVLTQTHIQDGGYYPVYGIPSALTYGSTVYDKGADVAFTLRGYLGDSLFFSTLNSYFVDKAFQAVTTEEFKNYFAEKTRIKLDDFFKTWVYTAGFPHFSIYKFSSIRNGNTYRTSVIINQQLKERNYYGKNNIADLVFYDKNLTQHKITANFSNKLDTIQVNLPFEAKSVLIDPENKVADAKVSAYFKIDKKASYYFPYTNVTANITEIKDSILIQATSNYINPDKEKSSDYKISDYLYWIIRGVTNDETKGNLEFFVSTYENKIFVNAEKVFLLYRPNSFSKFVKIKAEKTLKNEYDCTFKVNQIKFGQYAIGIEE